MAAYYGAKQQAEVLNAMAHINYQMRQNWKLLAWRYRVLGTLVQDAGQHNSHPPGSLPYWCPQNKTKNIHCVCTGPSCAVACSQAQGLFAPDAYGGAYGGTYCDSKYFICISRAFGSEG